MLLLSLPGIICSPAALRRPSPLFIPNAFRPPRMRRIQYCSRPLCPFSFSATGCSPNIACLGSRSGSQERPLKNPQAGGPRVLPLTRCLRTRCKRRSPGRTFPVARTIVFFPSQCSGGRAHSGLGAAACIGSGSAGGSTLCTRRGESLQYALNYCLSVKTDGGVFVELRPAAIVGQSPRYGQKCPQRNT